MKKIEKNSPAEKENIERFLKAIDFTFPPSLIDFFKQSNGAKIYGTESFVVLWPITELVKINQDYQVEDNAPEFFLFGTDGGGEAYAIEKATGAIFMLPFIVMSKDDAIFMNETFSGFLEQLE
jgi:hypothetical protein